MMSLFELSRLEERRISEAVSRLAPESIKLQGGGYACRGEPGSWINCAYGVASEGPVERAELERMSSWYEAHGVEPRFELNPFTDAETLKHVGDLGFRIFQFENVLYRWLRPGETIAPPLGFPPGITYRVINREDEEDILAHARVSMSGFYDGEPAASDYATWFQMLRNERTSGFVAEIEGKVVGAGAVEVNGEISALISLSVLPDFRRRGIQQALIAKRLEHAANLGARVATIGSLPNAGTERNVFRMGFQVAYTKVIMVRPGPGLMASLL
jgi:predicted N-acetyltransferase YhbS